MNRPVVASAEASAEAQQRFSSPVRARIAQWCADARARGLLLGPERRTVTPSRRVNYSTTLEAALRLILPWDKPTDYPGINQGSVQLLGRKYETIRCWRCGRNPAPSDIRHRLADLLEARMGEMARIVAELRVDDQTHQGRGYSNGALTGCMVVREDGFDRRGGSRWRRRKAEIGSPE